jgi:hypothetical protein
MLASNQSVSSPENPAIRSMAGQNQQQITRTADSRYTP